MFQRYATNYGGPLRKGTLIANNNGMQIFATILANTCYRIYADIRTKGEKSGYNPRHYLQDMFQRRLAQGRCFRTPALGWREFTCDYWGAFRNDWLVDEGIDLDIPSMLSAMWDSPHTGEYVSRFVQDVRISKGSLIYAE